MDTDKLIQLSNKVKARMTAGGLNEEQTKTALILPFFMALGYDIFDDTEFIPEYTADFGVKQGEKVDYAICINGQPMALIERKKLGTQLSSDHISQLFRYYASTDSKIGILTNGDDYWFFADSIKKNQMDREPYLKIKLSNLDNKVLTSLECYDRKNIGSLNILEDVQSQRFRLQALEFIGRVHAGNLPSDFIDFLASRYSVNNLEKSKLAAIFNESYKQTVLSKPGDKVETVTVTVDKSEQKKEQEKLNRSKAEDLPIGVPILFNTGNLAFHKPSSICIKGVEYQINSLAEMITSTMSYIINNVICGDKDGLDKFRTGLVERPLSIKLYESMNEALNDSVRGIRNIPNTGLYISTAFDAKTMQSIIEKAIGIVGISNDEVKIVLIR